MNRPTAAATLALLLSVPVATALDGCNGTSSLPLDRALGTCTPGAGGSNADNGAGGSGNAATNSAGGSGGAGRSVQPEEWVAFHIEIPWDPMKFHDLNSRLIGADAQSGTFLAETEIAPGIFVRSEAEPSTPDQSRVTIAFDDQNKDARRKIAVAPASFQLGTVFTKTADAALAKMIADNGGPTGTGQGEQFYLEYRVVSSMGGKLSWGVRGNAGVYSLVVDVTSPATSLLPSSIGQPALTDAPYDTVAGTVWFHLSEDDFDFFTNHAYGADATAKQNFKDFALVPHDWLRLTVDPHLDQKFVNVGFEVLTTDGARLPVAKAPASILAGDVFQKLVERNMTNMTAQEKKQKGSSTPWTVPFYYDNPNGGGVVQVIAQGDKGSFSIAYSIESPRNPLHDVEFVQYDDVTVTPPDPNATASCDMLGDPSIMLAAQGTLNLTFTASDTVLKSPDLTGPLVGTIYCSVFHAKDVNISGPLPGAQSLQDFQVANANLTSGPAPTFVTNPLLDGDYQVLCGLDLNGDKMVDKGDPVTLPIGAITVACNKNPATVQFALLDPG